MDNKDRQYDFLLWGVGIVFLGCALERLWRIFLIWMKSPLHQLLFFGVITVGVAALLYWLTAKFERILKERKRESSVLGFEKGAVFCGHTDSREAVFVKPKQRAMHVQVIGTTNAGKTESVILPWAIQDMEQGRGLVLIDGKADRSLLNKLWSYAVKAGREKDFRLFSLSNMEASHQFNPLIGGTPEEVSERVFNSFEFENSYYRSVQFEIFSQVMRIFAAANVVPTFPRLHQALTEPSCLPTLRV